MATSGICLTCKNASVFENVMDMVGHGLGRTFGCGPWFASVLDAINSQCLPFKTGPREDGLCPQPQRQQFLERGSSFDYRHSRISSPKLSRTCTTSSTSTGLVRKRGFTFLVSTSSLVESLTESQPWYHGESS